jgi:hypothetical protein
MENIPEARRRKRKQRAVLSCNDCRRRKLKCNRELPCNRCIHGGVAEKCAYGKDGNSVDSDTLHRARKPPHWPAQSTAVTTTVSHEPSPVEQESFSINTSSEHTATDRVTEEQRLASLEASLSSLRHNSERVEPSGQLEHASGNETLGASSDLWKGRGYRTFYYGPTNPMMVITHVGVTFLVSMLQVNDDSFPTFVLS